MRDKALVYLRKALNDTGADFRPGQWESINAMLDGNRLLVVERTGWGKSMVYFLATRLLRDGGKGPTLLISPLLSLMRNQIAAAARIGINAVTINSSNQNDWEDVEQALNRDQVDVLLISPERLANENFRQNMLTSMAPNVGMFVVDEAHCISDWGHDFRPDYRRIVSILRVMPPNIPVLATTATANNRVVRDVVSQLGDVSVRRGPLIRHSLRLQNIWMPSSASRLAWLSQHLPEIPGNGIIYTLTVRDAERVADFLRAEGIDVHAYHADVDGTHGTPSREQLEDMLLENRCKALVATVALGMGFDKPDLGFVIHFQRPGSVVHYYQQVGRAGRAVDDAYGILFGGAEDDDIINYFISSAFPPEAHVMEILDALENSDGLSTKELERSVNLSASQIAKVLTLLSVLTPSPVTKNSSKYYRTAVSYRMDTERISQLQNLRRVEQREMQEYMKTSQCLMFYLASSLDDGQPQTCGRCANCSGAPLLSEDVDPVRVDRATVFLKRSAFRIVPRKQWPSAGAFPTYGFSGTIHESMRALEGRALCLYGDTGWGELVRQGKYQSGRFDDSLVDACADMLRRTGLAAQARWITSTPSLHHPNLVPDFAQRLARKLSLPYHACIRKLLNNKSQKEMQNSWQQANNLDGAFEIDRALMGLGPVFLVDDMVDSRWTFTVLSALLCQAGCPEVIPHALALNSLKANGG
ncbi:MAG: RecQ family ATP-dependent DNA helicase [Bacteroidota bacterium]